MKTPANVILKGALITLSAYAIIALGDAFLKLATQHHPLLYVGTVVNLIQIVVILVIAPFFGGYKNLYRTKSLMPHLARGVTSTIVYLSFIYAISHMEIAKTYAFYLTQPFFLALFAHMLTHEKIGRHRIGALICGFCGVLIILRPGFTAFDLAVLAALSCAIFFACTNILVKIIDKTDHWMSFVFYILLVQTPIIIAMLLILEPAPFASFTPTTLPYMTITAIMFTAALALFAIALRLIDAALFGGLEYSVLIWGALFGYFMFAEVPDIWTALGALVIVASGLYLVYRERKAKHVLVELQE